jgi:hypothetical protein
MVEIIAAASVALRANIGLSQFEELNDYPEYFTTMSADPAPRFKRLSQQELGSPAVARRQALRLEVTRKPRQRSGLRPGRAS